MNRKIFLVIFLLIQVVTVTLADEGSKDAALIGQTMREIQARYKFSHNGTPRPWLSCMNGQTAPPFPSDSFYTGDVDVPTRARALVNDIKNGFGNIYGSFVDPSIEIEGSSPRSTYGFSSSAFPFLSQTVTETNYKQILLAINAAVKKLYIVRDNTNEPIKTHKGGVGDGSTIGGDGDPAGAKSEADGYWNQAGYTSFVSSFSQYSGLGRGIGDGFRYASAYVNSTSGSVALDFSRYSKCASAKARIYLATSYYSQATSASSTSPTPIDGKYHLKWSPSSTNGIWLSEIIGNQKEPYPDVSLPSGGTGSYNSKTSGWATTSDGPLKFVDCTFDTTANEGIGCCGGEGCSSGSCIGGKTSISLGSIHVQIGAGSAGIGNGSAYLLLDSNSMTSTLSTPAALSVVAPVGVTRVLDSAGAIRQLKTQDAFVNIIIIDNYQYKIEFYLAAEAVPLGGNAGFQPSGGSSPYKVITIQNPDASASVFNKLKITETVGTSNEVSLYSLSSEEGEDVWSLSSGNSSKVESLKNTWDETHTIRTEIRTIGQGDAVQSKTKATYQVYPWGEEKIQEISDPDGAAPLTASWSFYTLTSDYGYGHIKQWVDKTGYWERYEYDSNGELVKTIRQYLGAPVGTPESNSDSITIGDILPNIVMTLRSVEGNVIEKRYVSYTDSFTKKEEVCTNSSALPGDMSNLVTITKYSGSSPNRVVSITRPDGTATTYDRTSDTETVSVGPVNSPDRTTVTTYNSFGRVSKTEEFASGSTLIRREVGSSFDDFGRAQTWTYLDNTTKTIQYGCCGVESETDRDGITTDYTYDDLGNPDTETRGGITLDYDYDALGRLVKTTRIGSSSLGVNPISVVIQGATYDLAGRQTTETGILGVVSISEVYASGTKTRTENLLNEATRIEVTTTDGKLLSISGNGAHGLTYQYGVEPGLQYVKETQASGPWIKRYTNMVGAQVKVEYPGSAKEQFFYNFKGQLEIQIDADGVTTTFGYNASGEQDVRMLGDRITQIVKDVSTREGATVLRTQTLEGGVGVSMDEQSVTDRRHWHTDYDANNVSVSNISVSGPNVTKSVTHPDLSIDSEVYNEGRLIYRWASNTETTFVYDGNGRIYTEEDGRTGRVTTYTYNNKDQITSKDVNGGITLTTGYTYYENGQLKTETPPGSVKTTTREYWPTGELKNISMLGASKYLNYTYDSQGRMTTMTTSWSLTSTPPGTTTWTYSPTRGWLEHKSDGVNPSVDYTYYPSGRLETRKWSRGVETTYKYYSTTGDLWKVEYSDDTPDTIITYDNRGRRKTLADAAGIHTFSYWMNTHLESNDAISGTGILSGSSSSLSYDEKLRRKTFTATKSGTLSSYTYSYDGASRISSVVDNLGLGLSADYGYIPSSNFVDYVRFKKDGTLRQTLDKSFDVFDKQTLSKTIPAGGDSISYEATYDTRGLLQQVDIYDLLNHRFWIYGWDAWGQVISGKATWSKPVGPYERVEGQQFTYYFSPIGNRYYDKRDGGGYMYYQSNGLNQYTSRGVSSNVAVTGEIKTNVSSVTINSQVPLRSSFNNYFCAYLGVDNTTSPVYLSTIVSAISGASTAATSGKIFIPKNPEVFSYDEDGNLIEDGRWHYTWDAENRLSKMESLPAAIAVGVKKQRLTFQYDSQGRRISKTVENWNGTAYIEHHTLLYLYDGWNLAAEVYKQSGQVVRSYVWGVDRSGGQKAGGVGGLLFIKQSPENKVYSVGYDWNDNVTSLHDIDNLSLAARYEYGPFGELVRSSGYYAEINPVRWSTKYQDYESELVYYGNRYYRSSIGRWISRDPLGDYSFLEAELRKSSSSMAEHLKSESIEPSYVYVRNSPVEHIDYLGLICGVLVHRIEAKWIAGGWNWGHQWIEYSGGTAGFYPQDGGSLFGSPGNVPPADPHRNDPADKTWATEYLSMRVITPRLQYGLGKGKINTCATCPEINDCIKEAWANMQGQTYCIPGRDCRARSAEVLNKCGLTFKMR